MEELLERLIKNYLRRRHLNFDFRDVEVTTDRDLLKRGLYDELIYNVFIIIDRPVLEIIDEEEWDEIIDDIRRIGETLDIEMLRLYTDYYDGG